ncbi:MAG: hypothetical protein AAB353_01885 [Candidatus Hydrogenedentota bacterium]
MVRVFRADGQGSDGDWSFEYTDWQGKRRVGIGTESKVETQHLAERVQAEHDAIRQGMSRPGSKSSIEAVSLRLATADESWEAPAAERGNAPAKRKEVAPNTNGRADETARKPGDRIGEQLVEAGIVTKAQLEEGLAYQVEYGGKIVNALIQLAYLSAEQFLMFMGSRRGTPTISLDGLSKIPKEIIGLMTAEMAMDYEAIPLDKMGKTVSVAMVCPTDREALGAMEKHIGLKVRPLLCERSQFRDALWRFYKKTPDRLKKKTVEQ